MKINKKCKASTDDFWYDLMEGGYLKPNNICSNKEDADKINEAIKLLTKFKDECIENIPDFLR